MSQKKSKLRKIIVLCSFICSFQIMTACANVQISNSTKSDNVMSEDIAQKTMISYEESIIEAINKNRFSLVEGLLDPDGPLYKQQQTLIKRLNDIKIKEKLIKYQIMNIQKTNGVYKFYIIENIEIYYSTRESEINEYRFIYTVKEDEKKQEAKVYSIEKWGNE
ncbi:hypothetical protein Back11_06920 [Paenibacillus baekrokdamisoli]|uniref:TcaA protein NTF2-like domain-containing protein n=1 Tax=Paenibacillus baekrokdamisoli TaxID=1712516 RepID=A0A3G9IK21_9BACL|nr:hypothetical protein [Paenibacillus baekrokdamisoli]MBB3067466.1 hypothetical protein [Paenibacillus baekrokdamisoli]BBH19347.1 hypothetical protein Back11_06920 [Paenibacillus baekrokdamisoli]